MADPTFIIDKLKDATLRYADFGDKHRLYYNVEGKPILEYMGRHRIKIMEPAPDWPGDDQAFDISKKKD